MAAGGSYEMDKKTGKEVLKTCTTDTHAEGKQPVGAAPAAKNGGKK